MAAYARQAKDTELIQYATEIKVRGERKCGELLATTEKNIGARGTGSNQHEVRSQPSTAPTLAAIGITREQSSRYQSLASMSDEHFETAVATAKDAAGEVTTAFMLREARSNAPTLTAAICRAVDREAVVHVDRAPGAACSLSGVHDQPSRARHEQFRSLLADEVRAPGHHVAAASLGPTEAEERTRCAACCSEEAATIARPCRTVRGSAQLPVIQQRVAEASW